MSDEKHETIKAFIARMGLKFTATRVPSRPDRDEETMTADEKRWDAEAFHFVISFTRGKENIGACYSMGKGHALKAIPRQCKAPRADEVLDALISDAESWDNARKVGASAPDVDTFAREMGYDDEGDVLLGRTRERIPLMARARRAQRTFDACKATHDGLVRLLGADGFEALRNCERL